ncbi:MAG: tetratricopeptide repeat protein, partial [Phycisphaerae bacterium]
MRYVIVIAILCTVFAAWLAIDTLRAVPSDASIIPAESRAGSLPVPSPEAVFAVQSTPKAESAERQNSVEDPYGSANIRWAREDAEPVPFRDTARGILTRDPFDQAALTVAFADAKRDRDARLIAEYGSRLMQLDPENLDLVFDCVTALVGVNRLPDASRILAEARARFPESDALRRNFATIEQAQGRVSSAIGVWSQVLAEDPEDAQ